MFLDEARLVAELRHPNVVATLDFGEDDALSLYIVMEYIDGFSVQQLLRMAKNTGAPMPAAVALRVVIDALQGLQAAHDHADSKGSPLNIVHRDVSPQNILLGVDGVARIMDFGIARAESRLSHTRDGNIKGKAAYMAPEQHGLLMDNPPPLTHRADLYAMGVVLWELLTGKRLFQRENDAQTLAASIRGDYVPASELAPSLAAKIDVVIATALKANPDERFASGNAFIEAIESCGMTVASSREVTKWVREVANRQIEQRLEALRKHSDDRPDDANEVLDRVLTSATNARMQAEIEATGVVPASAAGDVVEFEVQSLVPNQPSTRPPRVEPSRWRPFAAIAIVAVLFGAAFAWTRNTPTTPAIARESAPVVVIADAGSTAAREPTRTVSNPISAPIETAQPDSGAATPTISAPVIADPTRRPVPLDGVRQRPPRGRGNAFRPTFL